MKYIKCFILATFLLTLLVSCGDTISIHSHSCGSWQIEVQPTCTKEGTLKRSCACGYTEHTALKPLSHSYSEKIILNPTCQERGLAELTCRFCGDIKYDILNKASHTPSEITVVTSSYHAKKCATCDTVVSKEEHFYIDDKCVICHNPKSSR